MTFEDVLDAEVREGEPRWMAAARLLERRFPDEFGPSAGSHISVQVAPSVAATAVEGERDD